MFPRLKLASSPALAAFGASLLFSSAPLSMSFAARAARADPPTRISIKLFGQPCVLEGPLAAPTLQQIHSISPEEICSPFSTDRTPEETRKALEHLKSLSGLPPSLDRYRERLTRRLSAELAFLEAMQEARKSRNGQPLVDSTKAYLQAGKRRDFVTLAKSFVTAAPESAKRKELASQLYDFYNEAIDASPEDEFHRAIRSMNVQYTCSFEESDESDSE
jgi:hypothetical protein